MVVQELGLVGRHVGMRRAVVLAAFAGQAQVQRFTHGLTAPAVLDDFAAEHFAEQSRAAARRKAFFPRCAITRAHHAAFVGAALAHADAALDRAVEALALKTGIGELRDRACRLVVGTVFEVLVGAVRIDDLARIHPVQRIPDRLEFAEGLHQRFTVHDRQEFGLGLAVAMFAG